MASEDVAIIGIGVETSGVEKGKKSLESLAAAGGKAEASLDKIGATSSNASKGATALGGAAGKAAGEMDKLGRSTEAVAAAQQKAGQAFTESARGLSALGGALAGALSVSAFIKAADSATILNNQLKLATGSAQAAASAYEGLFQIAQRSRVSFTELGSTFAAISRAGSELGISQQRLLGITEAIGNAMTISGGSAQGMQAALTQLGQGLASGTLRGEELNSVMEQTPRLAKALADGLGVTTGKLREMGAAGQLTAEQVIKALESQSRVLSGEVQNSVLTVGQAFTQLQNSTVKAVGEFDKATGASGSLAKALESLSGGIDSVGRSITQNEAAFKGTLGALAGGAAAAGALALAANMGKVRVAVTALGAVLAANPATLALLGIGAAVGAFTAYNEGMKNTEAGIRKTIAALEDLNKAPSIYARDAEGVAAWKKASEERRKEIARLRGELASMSTGNETDAESARLGRQAESSSALSRANKSAAESYDELRTRLSGFRGDFAKYQADLKSIQEGMASGAISEKEGITLLTQLAIKHGEVAKSQGTQKKATDALTESARDSAKQWASTVEDFQKLAKSSNDDALGLTKAEAALKAYLESAAYLDDVAQGRENEVIAAAALALENERLAETTNAAAKAAEKLSKADLARIEAADRSLKSVKEKLQSLELENEAAAISAEQNISLAQAIEEVEIARLREAQASLMQEGGRAAEVWAIQEEIEARKKLKDAIGSQEARRIAAKSAQDAADAWQKASEQIEKDITDALMRGFESGKGFAEVLRDTVVNMFKTMVLRPVIQATVQGGLNAVGLGLPGGQGGGVGGSLLGNAASNYATSAIGTAVFGSSAAYGAALGTTSIGAGSQAAMLAAQTGEFGLAGLSATSGAAGGAMSSLAAAGPYIAAVVAIAALAKSLDDSGTPHTGGYGSYSAAGGATMGAALRDAPGSPFGLSDDAITAKGNAAAVAMAQAVVGLLDSTAQTFGKNAGYSAATAFADDTSKDGAWGALSIKLGDKMLLNWADTQTSRWAPKEFANGEAGAKEYAAAVALDVRNLLMEQTPEWADTMLQALGDAPSLDALAATVGQINAAASAFEAMGKASAAFAGLTDAATSALVQAMGGIDAAVAGLSGYYGNFYTESERAALATATLTGQLAALGEALPASRDAFRGLIDDAIKAGDTAKAASLIGLSDEFAAIVPAAEDAAAATETAAKAAAQASTSALKSATDREKALWQTQADAASSLRDEVQGVFDTLASGISELRAEALGPSLTARGGMAFIDQAVAGASSGAGLPDAQALSDAIGAARGGLGLENFSSVADQQFAQLELAGKLESLQGVAGSQLSTAEQMLANAESQLNRLDDTLDYWEQQVGLAQGSVDATVTVEQAIRDLIEVVKDPDGSKKAAEEAAKNVTQRVGGAPGYSSSASRASLDDVPDYAKGSYVKVGNRYINTNAQDVTDAGDFYAASLTRAYYSPEADMLSTWQQLTQSNFAGNPDALLAAAAGAGIDPNIIASYRDEFLPKLSVGTNYIPQDGAYYLHKGEAVQPVAYNPALGGATQQSDPALRAEMAANRQELAELRSLMSELVRQGRRTADATNGNPEMPMLVTNA